MSTMPQRDMINMYCKKGDKVKVKKDLKANTRYGTVGFSDDMARFRGGYVTITQTGSNEGSRTKYKILEDRGNHLWSDAMFDY